jgi:putative SOS response-associated peptidase YedK
MCNLYHMTPKGDAERAIGAHGKRLTGADFPARTVGPFQAGAFLLAGAGADELVANVGQWGMIRPGQPERIDYIRPKPQAGKKAPAPRPRSTNNARIEGIESKPTFGHAWKSGQRCLIPADWYAEPNWETGKNIWWHLKRADGVPWFLAGLWSEWTDAATGEVVPNFTMITCNCDGHPLLGRLHKPDPKLPADQEDKRSLIHLDPVNWDQWLHGTTEEALALVTPQPHEVFDQTDARRTDDVLAGFRSGGLF